MVYNVVVRREPGEEAHYFQASTAIYWTACTGDSQRLGGLTNLMRRYDRVTREISKSFQK